MQHQKFKTEMGQWTKERVNLVESIIIWIKAMRNLRQPEGDDTSLVKPGLYVPR